MMVMVLMIVMVKIHGIECMLLFGIRLSSNTKVILQLETCLTECFQTHFFAGYRNNEKLLGLAMANNEKLS